jgi:hypothetical protein
MPIAVADIVGLGAPEIDRQLQLEFALGGVGQIDQGELGKLDAVDDLEPEGAPVKIDRSSSMTRIIEWIILAMPGIPYLVPYMRSPASPRPGTI